MFSSSNKNNDLADRRKLNPSGLPSGVRPEKNGNMLSLAGILKRVIAKATVPLLLKARSDEYPEVRETVERALKEIDPEAARNAGLK